MSVLLRNTPRDGATRIKRAGLISVIATLTLLLAGVFSLVGSSGATAYAAPTVGPAVSTASVSAVAIAKKAPVKAKVKPAGTIFKAGNCGNPWKANDCVGKLSAAAIKYSSGAQLLAGHNYGPMGKVTSLKKGNIVTIKGSRMAGRYKVTSVLTYPRKTSSKVLPARSMSLQTCLKNGKLRVVRIVKA